MAEEGLKRKLTAILSADVEGYSRLMGNDEVTTIRTLTSYREVVSSVIQQHRGRVVDMVGDNLLAEFASVVDAVQCAVEVQHTLKSRNAELPDHRKMEFRIGINLGDVVLEGDRIYGDGINIAARMESLAESGGICISGTVYNHIENKMSVRCQYLGEQTVKNITKPVRVYRVQLESETVASTTGEKEAAALPLPDKPSIAVLPFANMSGDQEQEYFADGITEDITTEVSKISGLLVISRNSTFTYKGKAAKAQDVCLDLGVRYVLEGSVRKAGERVRITAQLIDGRSGGHLWAERYDRGLVDIFAVQDDVTEKIVRALELNLAGSVGGRPARVETDTPEAYDCVLRGREQYRLYSKDGNASARQLYERAIELDPNYAAAYAGLAGTYLHEWFLGSSAALDQAFELAQRAKKLDQSLPLVHEALSSIHLFKKQHEEAIGAARQWVEIEPSSADGYANLAGILQFAGEPEQVIVLIEKAMRLNPFYPFYYTLYMGQAYLSMRRYEEAIEVIKRSVVRNPESLHAHLYLAACYGHLGKNARAREELTEVSRLHLDFSTTWVQTFMPYKRTSDLDMLVDGLHKAGLHE
ncbi:MAG: adenylate/guanylate cyclase domain-containing protein [Deltaproteobacteria bacterium]|nr:adenylate/guanylate cyclase domain-containing protein [Deltaproteobacteria bacterium]